MEQPEGHPYDTITGFLSGYDIRTVALLKFRSGGWWVLASSAEVEACGPSTEACYNPDVLVQWPEELGLGRVRWVLAAADHNVLTINAPRPGGGCGLVCVFPGGFREGLLKMKTDKASALLCEV